MSYTTVSATATCTIAGLDDTSTAALAVYDYLVNHPDEIPEPLNDDDMDSDEVVFAIESYLDLDDEELTISFCTESDGCYSSDVFDFLTSHFACLQTSPFMEVNWIVDDSRAGYSASTEYYDRQGEQINVRAILAERLG
jgi:hypothetical protein